MFRRIMILIFLDTIYLKELLRKVENLVYVLT